MAKADIEVNSLWRNKFQAGTSSVRVMAYVDGYVLARYKGRVPFVEHWRDWVKEYEPVESEGEVILRSLVGDIDAPARHCKGRQNKAMTNFEKDLAALVDKHGQVSGKEKNK